MPFPAFPIPRRPLRAALALARDAQPVDDLAGLKAEVEALKGDIAAAAEVEKIIFKEVSKNRYPAMKVVSKVCLGMQS